MNTNTRKTMKATVIAAAVSFALTVPLANAALATVMGAPSAVVAHATKGAAAADVQAPASPLSSVVKVSYTYPVEIPVTRFERLVDTIKEKLFDAPRVDYMEGERYASGVYVGKGLILTSFPVFLGADKAKFTVTLADGRTVNAKLISLEDKPVTFLRIEADDLPAPATIASERPTASDDVAAFGVVDNFGSLVQGGSAVVVGRGYVSGSQAVTFPAVLGDLPLMEITTDRDPRQTNFIGGPVFNRLPLGNTWVVVGMVANVVAGAHPYIVPADVLGREVQQAFIDIGG